MQSSVNVIRCKFLLNFLSCGIHWSVENMGILRSSQAEMALCLCQKNRGSCIDKASKDKLQGLRHVIIPVNFISTSCKMQLLLALHSQLQCSCDSNTPDSDSCSWSSWSHCRTGTSCLHKKWKLRGLVIHSLVCHSCAQQWSTKILFAFCNDLKVTVRVTTIPLQATGVGSMNDSFASICCLPVQLRMEALDKCSNFGTETLILNQTSACHHDFSSLLLTRGANMLVSTGTACNWQEAWRYWQLEIGIQNWDSGFNFEFCNFMQKLVKSVHVANLWFDSKIFVQKSPSWLNIFHVSHFETKNYRKT